MLAGRTFSAPKNAYGQVLGGAKRLIVVATPNGVRYSNWRPRGNGEDLDFAPGSMFEPLAPIAQHLSIIDGVDFKDASNHRPGVRAMFCAKHMASIDQHVAHHLGGGARFRSLELGVQTTTGISYPVRFDAGGLPVPSNDDPHDVFRRLNGDILADPRTLRVLRTSVLDVQRAELEALRTKLGNDESQKLELHLESLREVERSLMTDPPSTCNGIPDTAQAPLDDNDLFPQIGRRQMDLMVAALQCDMTRVASLQWSHSVSGTVFRWLGHTTGHHTMSHYLDENRDGVSAWVDIHRWYSEQFKYLIERLAALPEPTGEGTMLDNTLVVWATELGDSRTHDCMNIPFVLAGGAGGQLVGGRCVRYDHQPHSRLLHAICNAMGVDGTAYDDPDYDTGALPEVFV